VITRSFASVRRVARVVSGLKICDFWTVSGGVHPYQGTEQAADLF
jgi:hypothetical protein